MIVDTDVFIWHLQGNMNARKKLRGRNDIQASVVTYIELVQGMRNKQELEFLRKTFHNWEVKILYISEEISAKAMLYVERYCLAYSLELGDTLIAATAVSCGELLLTGNDKHFRPIKELKLKRFRP